MVKEKILVLCVDRDDDLGKKAKIAGPLIGKEANVAAATALITKDPEETDGNAIFQAVKTYEELVKEKGKEVRIATLTGDANLGYAADSKIVNQLRRVLIEFPANSCILVTDGVEDESILPVISSHIKITSVRTIVMKQAKELEKTWVVLLDKLKEPYYARLVFGIPAILLLAFLVSEAFGFGWRPIVALFGLYLLIKGFGLEESVLSMLKSLAIPEARTAFVVYLPAAALLIISVSLAISQYNEKIAIEYEVFEAVAYAAKVLFTFIPIIIAIIFIGKVISLLPEKKPLELIDSGLGSANTLLIAFVGYAAAAWVAGDAWFYEFLLSIILSIFLAYFAVEWSKKLKISEIAKLRLEGREVINEVGAYIGKVVGVDKKAAILILQTQLGGKMPIEIGAIQQVGEQIVIKG